jgi:hypothetical protein
MRVRAETVIEGKYSVKIMEYTHGWIRISVWDLGDRLGSVAFPPSVLLWVIENVQSPQISQPEKLARLFHETYERLAPEYGYKTREVPWDDVPAQNKSLMIAVAAHVLTKL